jgi:hypothetical protein
MRSPCDLHAFCIAPAYERVAMPGDESHQRRAIRQTGILRCEQQSDGTLVSYEFTFTGPVAWSLARMISRDMRATLARTKKRLESQ